MKYVFDLIQDQEYYNLKYELTKTKVQNNTTLSFRGETLTIEKAEAILFLMKKHINATH